MASLPAPDVPNAPMIASCIAAEHEESIAPYRTIVAEAPAASPPAEAVPASGSQRWSMSKIRSLPAPSRAPVLAFSSSATTFDGSVTTISPFKTAQQHTPSPGSLAVLSWRNVSKRGEYCLDARATFPT